MLVVHSRNLAIYRREEEGIRKLFLKKAIRNPIYNIGETANAYKKVLLREVLNAWRKTSTGYYS